MRPAAHFNSAFLLMNLCLITSAPTQSNSSAAPGLPPKKPRTAQSFVLLPPGYNRKSAPIPDNSDERLVIKLALDVWSITEISSTRMDMEVDLYVSFMWPDYRVKINETLAPPGSRLPVGKEAEDMWKPIVQFRNCKGCMPIDLDPKRYTMFYVSDQNSFRTVVRTLMRFTCDIDLRAYPMDRQICKIQLENYFEDTSQVVFDNLNKVDEDTVRSKQKLSEFQIEGVKNWDCTPPGEGSYACAEKSIIFARQIGYHLMTVYAPTTFIVLLSWISFWLPADVAPARITLGVTSLLTLATRLDQAQKNLPPVSYVKAIDVWMFACLFLVFSSLIEFAFSYYWLRNRSKASVGVATQTLPNVVKVGALFTINPSKQNLLVRPSETDKAPKRPREGTIIDRSSQIIFPLFFLIFNICYWGKYVSQYYK